MSISLDGHTSFIGTEFIKLLSTGSSDLATVEYVDNAVAEGGGGVQPEDVYTKTETDALLNAKLNVNNPQDIIGNLRLDPTNGLSKIILNAVNAPNDEDLYVNGSAYVNNGELRAQSMKCDNTLTFASIKGNFISNNDINTDLKFQINTNDFITLSTANDVIEVDKDIEMHSSVLKSDVLDTWSNASLQIRRNGINYISLDADDTISISRQSKIGSNKLDGVDMTVSHYNNTTNLFEKKLSFKNGNEIFATGDGGADEELLLNYYTDAGVRIGNATDAYLTIKGARNGTDTLTVNGSTYFGGAVSYNGDIVLTDPYVLKTNKVSSNLLNDLVFEIDTLGEFFRCQFSDNTVRLPNTKSFLSQNIFTDIIKPLGFSNDLVLYGGNNTNDAYEEYLRLDASTERVNFIKNIDTTENIYMNLNKRLYLNDTVGSERYIVSTFRSGTPSFNQLDIVNNNSSNGRIRLMINTEENVIIENSQLYSKRVITAVAGVKGNVYNSNGDNDVVFQRNDVPFMTLDKFTEDVNGTPTEREAIICSKQLRANANILVRNLQINQISVAIEYADFRLENADSVMRFYVGNSTGVNLQITNNDIQLNRATSITSVKTNLINSNGDNDVVFQRNGTPYLTLDDTDGVKASQSITVEGAGDYVYTNNIRHNTGTNLNIWTLDTIKFLSNATNQMEIKQTQIDVNDDLVVASGKTLQCNTINSNGNTDLVFQRNGVPYFTLKDNTGVDVIDVEASKGVSASYIYGNEFKNRGWVDTIFEGSNTGGTARVEYMRWDMSAQLLDFNAPIDNTLKLVKGNIDDTTPSDERLKTNIKDVESNFTECVKNVKIKTFEYTNEKYKNNDKYGFVAQQLLEHLPSEFSNIVRENKEKDSDDKYLSINYMKLSLLLWGALQETIARVEALEKPKKRTTRKTTT